jgi:hypothetical protein
MEGGSLLELTEEFLVRLGNRRVPPGSTILLFSITNLADTGVTGYAEELLAVTKVIKDKIGAKTRVLPLPPIVLGGVDLPATTRSLFELINWSLYYYGDDQYFLEESTKKARDLLLEAGASPPASWEFRRLVLPSKTSRAGRKVWSSGGEECEKWPATIHFTTIIKEKEYVSALIEDVRKRLALDLEPCPAIEQLVGPQSKPKWRVDFMVVGGSNGKRLSKALEDGGHSVSLVCDIGWTINRESCGQLAAKLATAIKDEDPAVVVLFLLDNSIFYTRCQDGGRALPKKKEDSRFHAVGESVVASRDIQTGHFHALKLVLDAVGG